MPKVLYVGDANELHKAARVRLQSLSITIEVVDNGAQALEYLLLYKYAVVILDADLTGLSGADLCREFRSCGGHTPVMLISSKNCIADKECGYMAGADDYLSKPYHEKELSLRVQALLRRLEKITPEVLSACDVIMDINQYKVTRSGMNVCLLPREFALLHFLMRHCGQLFTAESLLHCVWESGTEVSVRAVTTCVMRLRMKLNDRAASLIKTIRTMNGTAYMFGNSN